MPRPFVVVIVLACGATTPAIEAAHGQVASDTSATVVPQPDFQSRGVRRLFLGGTYRDQWSAPITAPVLDLDRHGGGMVATERGGSKQSRSLRFEAADGRMLVFRALEKDPTQTWPAALRASAARKVAEDQISAILPAGAVAVAELEQAVGLINPGVDLVILPDHPRLGEWREEFAGNLGILEQRLRGSGIAIRDVPGAVEVVTSERLFDRLLDDGRNVIDQEGYLTARLFDLVVGDWDRHAGQWAWARFDEAGVRVWRPIPRDRDWALSRLDGPLYGLLRLYLPKYQTLDPGYGSIYGLTLSAEALDRRLLAGLGRQAWDSVAGVVTARLTDSVITAAAHRLPPSFGDAFRDELAATLVRRRDELPGAARKFYRLLSGAVELRGSDQADRVDIGDAEDGGLRVTMRTGAAGAVRFDRTFDPRETRELRLYLGAGRDSVRWLGGPTPRIRVRLIDPEGPIAEGPIPRRQVFDSTRRPMRDDFDPALIRRDWGTLVGVIPWVEARPEIGMLVGGGPVIRRFGFRKTPYASRVAIRSSYATGAPGINLDFRGDFRFIDPTRRVVLEASYLRVDVTRYFGTGNETVRDREAGYYHVRQRLLSLAPSLEWTPADRLTLGLGGFLRSSATDLDRPTRLADETPYGSGSFTEVGAGVRLQLDTRDHPVYPTRGVRASLSATAAPPLFDVDQTFAVVSAALSTYLTAQRLPASPTLALRAGGSRAAGPTPFFDAPTLGGRSSVRGLNSRRFLGDASLYGSTELRLALGGFTVLVPGEWGVFGLADVGRVYRDGEVSDRWHSAGGAGLWFALLDRSSTVTVTMARSEERDKLYVQAGFHF